MKPQVKRSICVSGTIYSSIQGATLLTLKKNQILLTELIVLSASTSAKYAPNYTLHFELLLIFIVLYNKILKSEPRCHVLGKQWLQK